MNKGKGTPLDIEEIIETYADMVYRIAYVQMKKKSDADDIFQEVFLRLVNYIDTLQGEEHIKPWLIRVTINCCHKQYNSAWRKKTVAMADEQFAEEVVVKDDELENVLEACWELPEAQRIVIHLFYLEGYSIREISQLLEQSESSVKTRLSRARGALRDLLKGDLVNEGKI
ncbi:RNA polymerase sigma factor [Enterococcus sp. LJL99]